MWCRVTVENFDRIVWTNQCTTVTFQLVFRITLIESENPIESLSNHDILTDVLI